MAETSPPILTQPPPAEELPRWHGDGLIAQSIRFTLTVMAPVVAGALFGADLWVAYALLTGILGYMMDTGGPALPRLGAITAAGVVVLAGAALGTLVSGSIVLITLALAFTGLLYGLVESSHQSAAMAGRFFSITFAVGALYIPLQQIDAVAVGAFVIYTWLVSVAWDLATGMWRPSTAPKLQDIVAYLKATRAERWLFATVVAGSAVAAFLTCKALGLERPNWALLAIVVVLRADAQLSRQMIINLMLGTIVGVAAAFGYNEFFPSPIGLTVGMVIAALVRWPLQQLHGALGLAAMAAFIVLLLQLVSVVTGIETHASQDRLIDITIGCLFGLAAIWINGKAQAALRSKAATAP